jgi:hypothetical protein
LKPFGDSFRAASRIAVGVVFGLLLVAGLSACDGDEQTTMITIVPGAIGAAAEPVSEVTEPSMESIPTTTTTGSVQHRSVTTDSVHKTTTTKVTAKPSTTTTTVAQTTAALVGKWHGSASGVTLVFTAGGRLLITESGGSVVEFPYVDGSTSFTAYPEGFQFTCTYTIGGNVLTVTWPDTLVNMHGTYIYQRVAD